MCLELSSVCAAAVWVVQWCGVLHSGKTGFRIADNATTTMELVDYAKPKLEILVLSVIFIFGILMSIIL